MIADNLKNIKSGLPDGVTLVAVSKFHPVEKLMEAYAAGQRDFGESRVQELLKKVVEMPDDVRWHFIGHLQTNKVRQLLPVVGLIHSVDSEKLLEVIDREAQRIGKVVDVLLEVHVAQEESKFGFVEGSMSDLNLAKYENVRVRGVMGMATNDDNEVLIANEFDRLRKVFEELKTGEMAGVEYFNILSMGMSGDYGIAVKHGSTMVRVGTSIFGEREY